MITFIAEIGINHRGNLRLARDMIIAARVARADIVKFQMYDPIKILGKESPYIKEATKAQFTKAQHKLLKEFCSQVGIEYCCSVFHPEDVKFFEGIGMKRYKIASRSTKDIELLEAVKATGKPVIASNGLDKELVQLKSIFQSSSDLSVLECIPKYPTSFKDIEDEYLTNKRILSWPQDGLSSHCPSIVPSLSAIMYGATIIEHHVKFRFQRIGCDLSSSITFEQFRQMVDITRSELC